MTVPLLSSMGVLVVGLALGTTPVDGSAQTREVTVNRVRLTSEQITSLERQYRVRFMDGDYWYDSRVGIWGFWGGAAAGFAVPGLDVGGPLPRNASGGGTSVFVNGRELHRLDVAGLQMVMMVLPGRYWLDASGWSGYEGGPPLFNVWALAAQAMATAGGRADPESWVFRGLAGGMSARGGCIGIVSGDVSASVGC